MFTIRSAFPACVACSSFACSATHDEVWLDDGQTSGFADPTAESGRPPHRADDQPRQLGDEFDEDALVGWKILNHDAATIAVADGSLELDAHENTEWGSGQTSVLVWKRTDGDFMVTASLRASGLDDPDSPPPPIFRFGGLLARDPDSDDENNLYVALGTDDEPSIETKSTVDGESTSKGPSWPTASGELRICRLGSSFLLYVREEDGAWQLADAFARPDLPNALAVGPMAYNDSPEADLRVAFDFVHFADVASQADCER